MLKIVPTFFILLILSTLSAVAQEEKPPSHFYTYHHQSGNRIVEGADIFPDVQMLDVPLAGVPTWAVGYTQAETAGWVVTLQDGRVQMVDLVGETASISTSLAPGQPPIVEVNSHEGIQPIFQSAPGSTLTHPIPVNETDLLYVDTNGDLVLLRETEELARVAVNSQPDARLVVNQQGRIALYRNATNQRYVHGIMGDDLEGASVLMIEVVDEEIQIVGLIDLGGEDVFEGIAPIWADVNEDGTDDLITTVSNGDVGARIRAYLFDGEQVSATVDGPAIGLGHRWRHQLAWGVFGPNGEMELVDVLTPHIGGVVEFFQYDGTALNIVERLPAGTSHVIGSRNLDMAVAGDFNGDGQLEIVIMDQSRTTIVAVQHTADGAQVVWTLPVDGRVITNLAALTLSDGRLALAVGTEDGRLRVWTSR